jgi:hypothetical protein
MGITYHDEDITTPGYYQAARKRGKNLLQRSVADFHENKLNAAISRLVLSNFKRRMLDQVLNTKYPSGHLPMSNKAVRLMTWDYLSASLISHFNEHHKPVAKISFGFLTLCWDEGITAITSPDLDIVKMKHKARRAIRDLGAHGIAAIDIHPLRHAKGGRQILAHVHSIIWWEKGKSNPKRAAKSLQRRFPNSFGAKGIKITTRKQAVAKRIAKGAMVHAPSANMTDDDLAFLAAYMLKAPNMVKRLVCDPGCPEKSTMKTTADGYSDVVALHMARIWSYVTPYDAIFAIGDGKHPRAQFAFYLRRWAKNNFQRQQFVEAAELDDMWNYVGKRNSKLQLGAANITAKDGLS